MTMQHSGWRASRNRTLNHFEVLGLITKPDEQQPDSTSMVTTGISLLKLDHQPLLPSILILRLYVTQERRFPYVPPAQPLTYPARYYREPIGTDEEACTTVRIRHNGETLIEIHVIDD